jgi:hypothetical protein
VTEPKPSSGPGSSGKPSPPVPRTRHPLTRSEEDVHDTGAGRLARRAHDELRSAVAVEVARPDAVAELVVVARRTGDTRRVLTPDRTARGAQALALHAEDHVHDPRRERLPGDRRRKRLEGRSDREVGRAVAIEVTAAESEAETLVQFRRVVDPRRVLRPQLHAGRGEPPPRAVEDRDAPRMRASADRLTVRADREIGVPIAIEVPRRERASEFVVCRGGTGYPGHVLMPQLAPRQIEPARSTMEQRDRSRVVCTVDALTR